MKGEIGHDFHFEGELQYRGSPSIRCASISGVLEKGEKLKETFLSTDFVFTDEVIVLRQRWAFT